MTISLFIIASDLPKFHAGEKVKAIPDSRSSSPLDDRATRKNPLINVLVSYDEIVSTEIHKERGMVKDDFLYYMIKQNSIKTISIDTPLGNIKASNGQCDTDYPGIWVTVNGQELVHVEYDNDQDKHVIRAWSHTNPDEEPIYRQVIN